VPIIPALLAERRAQARALGEELKKHRRECRGCMARQPCGEARELAAELAAARDDIGHWFDPGPDQAALFEPEQFGALGARLIAEMHYRAARKDDR
jgi:hypothetical protein